MSVNWESTLQQSDMIVTLNGKNSLSVASFDDAVAACAKFRDSYDYGFGMGAEKYYSLRVGRVMQGNKNVARVHYNGRVEML